MKKLFLIAALFSLSQQMNAAELNAKSFGLGIFVGEPTGLTAKYWFSRQIAGDANISYSFDSYFLFSANALYHYRGGVEMFKKVPGEVIPYIGAGGGFGISSKTRKDEGLGFIRVPLGLEWKTVRPTLGVFIEVAPGVGFVPKTDALIWGGIGVRYYF